MGLPGCLFVCHLILLLMCFLFNMHADNKKIDAVYDNINKVQNVRNNELAIVDKWCTYNKMIINAVKPILW